ncbi:hypothetical protein VTJ04DRAFT_4703 [Mycothermus thermophilus]|uniref:uncharacterized protein n=1 Tax=Humicola insolens TaxID=85995 RepID=UPI00374420E0
MAPPSPPPSPPHLRAAAEAIRQRNQPVPDAASNPLLAAGLNEQTRRDADADAGAITAIAPRQDPAATTITFTTSATTITIQLTATATPLIYADTISAHYGALYSGPSAGAVVGITLGAVAGFLLLLWMIYLCINLGNPDVSVYGDGTSTVVTEGSGSVYIRRSGGKARSERSARVKRVVREKEEHHHHHHHHRASARLSTSRRSSSRPRPVIVDEMASSSVMSPSPSEIDVIEERRRSSRRYSRSGPPRPPLSSVSGTTTTEDEVVVIEESSSAGPSTPSRHRRGSGYGRRR